MFFLLRITYYIILKFFKRKDDRTVVIYYHGIKEYEIPNFIKQIEYLEKYCNVISITELFNQKKYSKKISVAITFDDGYLSVKEIAIPLLMKYNFKAAFFIPVGNIGNHPKWEFDKGWNDQKELVMTGIELKELEKDGYEIYSHTMSHPHLQNLNEKDIMNELQGSKQKLKKILNHEIIAISYPYGSYDKNVYETVKKVGYALGFTNEPEIIDSFTDKLLIGRTSVSPSDSIFIFKMKINGAFQIKRCLKIFKNKLTGVRHNF